MEADSPLLPEATFAQLFEELRRRGDAAIMGFVKGSGTKDEILEWRFSGCAFLGIGLCDFMRQELLTTASETEDVDDEDR
jgi:hypothetical protein